MEPSWETKQPVTTLHRGPYSSISPLRPELSQAGKTILVCGGSTGIGQAIARNFCAAGAAKVIILGRRRDVAKQTAAKLAGSYSSTKVEARECNVFDMAGCRRTWEELEKEGTGVDVLVWNAVAWTEMKTILNLGVEAFWKQFEENVRAPVAWLTGLSGQKEHGKQKSFLYVSTQSIHRWNSAPAMPSYQSSKHCATTVLQCIAQDTPVDKVHIVCFHPSVIFTEVCANAGLTPETMPYELSHDDLPGQFAVWAASSAAKFLHGRFVWCEWDVDELSDLNGEARKKMEEDPYYLVVGVRGL